MRMSLTALTHLAALPISREDGLMQRGGTLRTMIIGAVAFALISASAANAQTSQSPTAVPTPHNRLFGSDWAKPPSQTGGYFYNDPRLQNSNQPLRPGLIICPRGRICY
jgi:hypothetical protein